MTRQVLEDWINVAKSSDNSADLINKCGIYNDFFFYFKFDEQKRKDFLEFLVQDAGFEKGGEMLQRENHYKTDFEDVYLFSSKIVCKNGSCNQLNVRFPNKGITFSPNTLPCEGKEIGFNYSGLLQLGLFGSYSDARDKLVCIGEEFILPNKIPTYISTTNCKDEKYQRFSVFIND